MKFQVSLEMMRMAAEKGATEAVREYIEGAYAVQFPDRTLTVHNINLDMQPINLTKLDLQQVEVEVVE